MMMLAKIAALGLFKIKEFWNKGYGVIIFLHDVTNRIYDVFNLYCGCSHVTKDW